MIFPHWPNGWWMFKFTSYSKDYHCFSWLLSEAKIYQPLAYFTSIWLVLILCHACTSVPTKKGEREAKMMPPLIILRYKPPKCSSDGQTVSQSSFPTYRLVVSVTSPKTDTILTSTPTQASTIDQVCTKKVCRILTTLSSCLFWVFPQLPPSLFKCNTWNAFREKLSKSASLSPFVLIIASSPSVWGTGFCRHFRGCLTALHENVLFSNLGLYLVFRLTSLSLTF